MKTVRFFYVSSGLIAYSIAILVHTSGIIGMDQDWSLNTYLSLGCIVLSIIMLAFSLSTSSLQFVSALFWIFEFVFFGIVPFSVSLDDSPLYLARLVSKNSFDSAYVLNFCAIFSVAISQLIFFRMHSSKNDSTKDLLFPELQSIFHRLRIISFLYLVAFIPLLSSLGGFSYLTQKRRYLYFQDNSLALRAILESLLHVPPIVIFVGFILLRFKYKMKIGQFWFLGFGLLSIVLSNPQAFPRQLSLFMLMPIIFLLSKKFKRTILTLLLLLPSFLLFAANLVDRRTGNLVANFTYQIPSRTGDFDAFIQLANGIDKIKDGLFPIFYQILGSIFFFVPRSLWENKPFDTGVTLATSNGLIFKNLSAPWILEALVNARGVGVILLALGIGRYLGRYPRYGEVGIKNLMMSAMISGSLFILLRGSLLQATGRVVFSYVLIHFLVGRNVQISKKVHSSSEIGV